MIYPFYPFLAYSSLGTERTIQGRIKRYHLHNIENGLDLKKKNLKCNKCIVRNSKKKKGLRSKVFFSWQT